MPKKYPVEVKDGAVRMVLEHQGDYSSITATYNAVGPRLGIPHNTLRRWVGQARIDEGDKPGTTTTESDEVKALRKEVRRLREANQILRSASIFFAGARPAPPLICAFVDHMRARGFAVESVCAVLREQGCKVAARTYRAGKRDPAPAARTVSDAVLIDALRTTAGQPESLYGRLR